MSIIHLLVLFTVLFMANRILKMQNFCLWQEMTWNWQPWMFYRQSMPNQTSNHRQWLETSRPSSTMPCILLLPTATTILDQQAFCPTIRWFPWYGTLILCGTWQFFLMYSQIVCKLKGTGNNLLWHIAYYCYLSPVGRGWLRFINCTIFWHKLIVWEIILYQFTVTLHYYSTG